MKKTIQINLAGTVFHIDDDAYEILRKYINSVESKFSRDPGGSEVLNDLESRMAELFSEKLKNGREVINVQDVREVLEVMGAPKEMGSEERRGDGSDYRYKRRYKRMYRDPDDKPIGGVCSGLAYYFNTDPLLIRILFVIGLFVGFGFLLYLVLWIALPMAETPEEIEEMRSGTSF
jgi:phage shock protein PspC (stress-responsive transcriptional regulator)